MRDFRIRIVLVAGSLLLLAPGSPLPGPLAGVGRAGGQELDGAGGTQLLHAEQPRSSGSTATPAAVVRDTGPLSLGEAVGRALDRYPMMGVSRAAREAARADHGRAKAAWWPEVGLAGSLTRHQDPMIVSPIHGFAPGETPAFDETLIEGGGYLTWTLFDGGGREARIRQARSREAATGSDLEAAAQSVIADVAGAYLAVLSHGQILAAHDRRIAALEAELARVRQLREVGRAAEIETLRVEAALASARADRVGVATRLELARRELARLMAGPETEPGDRGLVPLRFAGGALPSRRELAGRAAAASPAVEAARRRHVAAEAGLSLARSVRWPAFELFGNWVDHTGLDSDHEIEWAAGVRASVPLFTGGRIGDEVARADAETRLADERLRLAVTEAARAVDRAVSDIEEAMARLRSLETAVLRSGEVVRIERLRLETGAGTQPDYLDAEAELLVAEAALAETRHAAIHARVELARVLGSLGPAWLEENLETGP